MKSIKPFFEFWIKIVVRAATRDKHITFYVRAFATIFIPCLLQFPLMAYGKDGHDVVNSGLMPGKGISESTVTHKAVSDIGKLGGKSSLVGVDGRTNSVQSVPIVYDPEASKKQDQRSGNTEKPQVGGAEGDIENAHILLSVIQMYMVTLWTIWRLLMTSNVELTGGALLRRPG